jgi:acyl carrier protein
MMDYRSRVRTFIVENFLFGEANELQDDTSFLEEGIIDSTGVLELIEFIEKDFELTLKDEEIVPENLDSIDSITEFLTRKLQAQHPDPAITTSKTA